jgi:hypothetical protein
VSTGEHTERTKESLMRRVIAVGLVALSGIIGAVGAAQAADVTLYEISEAVKLDAKKGGKFKGNAGTLTGWANAGTTLCPQWVVDAYDSTAATNKICGISVEASGKADDVTGIGPVEGTITVLVQDKNQVDAPEIAVLTGKIKGTINMSPAFMEGRPLGSISGTYELEGDSKSLAKGYKGSGRFSGTFRLPFVAEGVTAPQYLLDDGTMVAIAASEYVLRYPAVRLEVMLTGASK